MTNGNETIYLDYNASAPVHPEVAETVRPLLTAGYGNPSSPHAVGQEARDRVEQSRRQVARLLGCRAEEIVFTSGGSESNNLAVKGTFLAAPPGRRHIVLSAVEHPSVTETCRWLAGQGGELTIVPVDRSGRVDPEEVEARFRPETLLVSIMHANNETGTLQPVEQIARAARQRGILFHVDGVQAAGKVPVDVRRIGCDFYSVSAHKLGGLKGAGGLYVRSGTTIEPLLHGGGQEAQRRGGTENVPGIVALGKAAEVARRDLEANAARNLEVRSLFDRMAQTIAGARVNGHPTERLPNTANLCFLDAEAMNVVTALSAMGICVGSGSACESHAKRPSAVLRAMGLSDRAALCSIRISSGPGTTLEQARLAADRIAETVARIRLVTDAAEIGSCDQDCPCFFRPTQ